MWVICDIIYYLFIIRVFIIGYIESGFTVTHNNTHLVKMMDIDILRDALIKNENEKIIEIESKCLYKIKVEVEKSSQYGESRNILRDDFSESLITERMKNLIMEGLDT